MKKFLLSLAAVLTASFTFAQTNLLSNPGFEEWDGSTPTYWKTASTAGNATLSQSEDARSGAYAVQITNASQNKRMGYNEITLKAGTYTFSFYAMGVAEGASVRPGYVPVTNGSVGDYVYGAYTNSISTTDWQLITNEFTLSEETTISLVIMSPKKTASVLIDDASLTTEDGGIAEAGDDNGEEGGEEEGGDDNTVEEPAVSIANTPETAYTPAEAIALIDAGKDLDTKVYVKGIISSISEISTSYGNATYNISADGTTGSTQFTIFRGYYLDGEKFTSEDQLNVGNEVIVYGKLTLYGSTYEMTTGSKLCTVDNLVASKISSVESANNKSVIYNLNGQRVQKVQPGKTYIINNKKVLVK